MKSVSSFVRLVELILLLGTSATLAQPTTQSPDCEKLWESVSTTRSLDVARTYLYKCENSERASEAKLLHEELLYVDAVGTDDPILFAFILNRYPTGKHANDSKKALTSFATFTAKKDVFISNQSLKDKYRWNGSSLLNPCGTKYLELQVGSDGGRTLEGQMCYGNIYIWGRVALMKSGLQLDEDATIYYRRSGK